MNSTILNAKIAKLADNEEYEVKGLESTSKCIPYIGWYWREVDFSRDIWLGYTDGGGGDIPDFVGFMENNKWGYPTLKCTDEQGIKIKSLLVKAVTQPSNGNLQAVFDYMQSLRPKK